MNFGIARRVVWWTVANRSSVLDSASGVGAAAGIRARIDGRRRRAQAASVGIADAAGRALASVAADRVRTDGVRSARVLQAFVDICWKNGG